MKKFLRKIDNWINENALWLIVIYVIVILIISLRPHTPSPEQIILGYALSDKLKHAVFYFGFGFLLQMVLKNSKISILSKYSYISAIIIGSLVGVFDELIQLLSPERMMDFFDIAADSFGIALSQVVRWIIDKVKK